MVWFRAPRAPLCIIVANSLRGLEEILSDDCGNR